MRDRRRIAVLLMVCVVVGARPTVSRGQRVQFPAAAPTNPFTTPPSTFAPSTPAPSLPASPYGAAASPYSVAPAWDPYAPAGAAATPPPALPPYGQPPAGSGLLNYPFQDWRQPNLTSTRLIQDVSLRNTWLAGNGANDFGVDDLDLSTTLAFPFFYNLNVAPILFTPGFSFHFFNGPDANAPRDLPGTVYDAFGQFSWRPQVTERLGFDLGVSFGVYSDFTYVNRTSFRILGRGVGLWTINPQWQAAAGVVYLDRLETKILPAGGFIWRPHDDARFEILFPQPKLAQRITNYGNAEIWGYVGGEYGGGQWSISHVDGSRDEINYNDFRIFLGVEAFGVRNLKGHFEIGYVFNREIIYRNGSPPFEPDSTVMIRTGLGF